MTKKQHPSDDFADLRRRAEEQTFASEAQTGQTLSPEEAGRLLHELQVHQIELEMQNEELRRAQGELEASRARYFDLFELSPVGYFTLSDQGLILEANLMGSGLLGVGRRDLMKQPLAHFVLPEDQNIYYRHRKQLIETGEPQACELRMLRADVAFFWARLEATVAQDGERSAPVYRTVVTDISERKQAEEVLRKSERFKQAILDSLPAHVAVLDRNGRILDVNEPWVRFARENGLGDLSGACVGADYLAVCRKTLEVADPLAQEALEGIQAVLDGTRDVFYLEYPCHSPSQHRWFLMHVSPSREATGGVVIAHTDITSRKQAEEMLRVSEEKYRTYVNNSPTGVFVADSTGRYVEVNAFACRLLGYSKEELTRMAISDIVAPDYRQSAMTTFQEVIQSGSAASGEFCFVRKDGSRFFMSVHAVKVQEDRIIAFCIDITKRRIAEQSLKQHSEALLQANQRLEEACDKAEAANRVKSEFLANMSHEIRTPMTAILGSSDVLTMCPELSPSERRTFLELIQKNGKALLGLIDDILDLSRIEADRMPLEKKDYPLQLIVDDVISAVQVQAEQKNLSLDVAYQFPLPETIHTDPVRLRQVLVNLVGNAVKFTGQGEVRIAIACTREANGTGRMQFAFSDTGIGIAADKIADLFQPFMQVDASSTRRYSGTGLGLAISRRLAKVLGGDIEVTSQLGKGSTFTLTIDGGSLKDVTMLQSPHAAPAVKKPLAEQQEPLLHGRVLLAEDAPGVQSLVVFLLKKMNLEVDLAEDGRIACKMAKKSRAEGKPYDLIFMDILMPEMNGYEATRWLREHGWRGPIVALTAYAMVGDREKCLAAGCDDYIAKPMTPQTLHDMLIRYILGPDNITADHSVDPITGR